MQESTNIKKEVIALGLNQIIAKTLLVIFGIFICLQFINFFATSYPIAFQQTILEEQNRIANFVYCGLLAGGFVCTFYFFIVNSNWLMKKIEPIEEPVKNPELWFTVMMRAALVLTGLILIASNLDTLFTAARFIIQLPPALREMITNAIQGNKVFDTVRTREIYKFITAVLSIYLIAGGPGFVNWQINKNFKMEINNE